MKAAAHLTSILLCVLAYSSTSTSVLNISTSVPLSTVDATATDSSLFFSSTKPDLQDVRIQAVFLDRTSSKKNYNQDGVIFVFEQQPLTLDLFGVNLHEIKKLKFTSANNSAGEACAGSGGHYQGKEMTPNISTEGYVQLIVPEGLRYYKNINVFYLCIQVEDGGTFIHQGNSSRVRLEVTMDLLPNWMKIIFIVVCLLLSGTFSGLNLGLMSLDKTELKIIQNCGSDKERGYAEAIMPVRKHGNFLLCSILLGNVLVNNSLTILLDSLLDGGGAIAVVFATLAIVIFGEIIPQAICSRHGLAAGAYTIWLTKFFMFLTSPLAFPLSKLLDCCLGLEIGTVYNKRKLMELLKVTDGMNDLDKEEVNIVTGALVLSKKIVKDVMTNIEDCYMLPTDKVLDFEAVSDIKSQGYSRIPVYDGVKTNVVYILFAKDLLFLDTDDEMTVEEVCKFYQNEPNFVLEDVHLNDIFNEFKTGEKGHMAIVKSPTKEEKVEEGGDIKIVVNDLNPTFEVTGVVTLEDIIEEIIQSEIIDETDVIIDNKSKKKRNSCFRRDADFKLFAHKSLHHVNISPQMSLAVLQFLTTNVKAFNPEIFSQRILQKLLSMDVYREIKMKSLKSSDGVEEGVIMRKGVPCNFFILIIEGRVEITIGKEDKKFHEGPFSCFGEQILRLKNPLNSSERSLSTSTSQSIKDIAPWLPDYKVKAVTDVTYLKIRRGIYQLAVKANKLYGLNNESREDEILEVLSQETKHDAELDVSSMIKSSEKIKSAMSSLSLKNQLKPIDINLRKSSTSLVSSLSRRSARLSSSARRNNSMNDDLICFHGQ